MANSIQSLRPPVRWELTLDPNKKRWDSRSPVGGALLEEDGLNYLLDESGNVLLEE